ncbi:MAG: metalloregulator ArsR/SmtB family transcription factor [Phycisphaerales bacterium]|nr:metalloregulator ArsR/SmtB family transcription factor [Phycisphaerales bacterium]
MDDARFNLIAKALADPQRFAILQRIARQDDCPCMALVDECSITQATISHHLKELSNADLISVRREGKCGYFTLKADTLAAYQAEIARRLLAPAEPAGRAKTA